MNNTITWKSQIVFTLSKENGVGLWESKEQKTGGRITRGKTRKSCLAETLKILEAKGLSETLRCIEWQLRNSANKSILHSESTAARFREFFKVEISPFIGKLIDTFDIVEFDRWLKTPDGTSTKEYIKQKYGEQASNFVEALNQL